MSDLPDVRPHVLVVTLTIRAAELAVFRDFEHRAARIMARYGGAIERAIVLGAEASTEIVRELHIVAFPDRAAFDSYRSDAELVALTPLRERAVLATSIERGTRAPRYGA